MRLKGRTLKLSLKTRAWILVGVWVCVGIVAFFCSTTGKNFSAWTRQTWQMAAQKSGRSLQPIKIDWESETHYTREDEVRKTIGLNPGTDMSTIDLKQIKQKVEKLPLVRECVVERYWPDTIRLTIKEKLLIAIWQNNRQYHPLDEYAEVINTTKQLPADLLLVVGPDAPQHLIRLIRDLEQVPDIYQYVRSAVRINERRWDLKLFDAEKGLNVVLPETGVLDALKRLDEHNKKEKLIKRQLALVDLRTKGKVVYRPIETDGSKKKVRKK